MARTFRFLMLIFWAVAAVAAQPIYAASVKGAVRLVAHPALLLETRKGAVVVFLQPHTLLEGVGSGALIAPGDAVTISYEIRKHGALLAERVTVKAKPALDGKLLLDVVELGQLLSADRGEGLILVDCREMKAFAAGHIPGAVSLKDAGDLLSVRGGGKSVILVGNDRYSAEAMDLFQRLRRSGHGNVLVLAGGTVGWSQSARVLEVLPEGIPMPVPPAYELLIFDVRSPEEFARGHLPGAFNVPVDSMRWQEFSRLSGMPPLVFYGDDSGDGRPSQAAGKALGWRFQKFSPLDGAVGVLAGGIQAWRAAGKPLGQESDGASFSLEAALRPEEISASKLPGPAGSASSGPLLVDLRKGAEARPLGAIHLPLESLLDRMGELPKDREIVLFCTMGVRARIGYTILKQNGFRVRYLREAPAS